MKIFLSWSGASSNEIAQALRHWLPAVLQATRPYFSPDDIAKGARWSNEVALELQESRIGILSVTRENLAAPWLMFEAGALAKSLGQSHVIPLLLGVEPADLSGPLAQFQAARFDRTDVRRMMSLINQELGPTALEEEVLSAVFDKWWPDLEAKVKAIELAPRQPSPASARTDRELLEEVLTLMRERTFRAVRWQESASRPSNLLSVPIDELQLTDRAASCLKAENVYTIGDLLARSETDLIKTPNLGRKALNELKEVLASLNLKLKADDSPPEGG